MAAFRRALARMRAESERLQRNRLTASAIQRNFRLVVDDGRAEPEGCDYSSGAAG
jgi:hypothetical protein